MEKARKRREQKYINIQKERRAADLADRRGLIQEEPVGDEIRGIALRDENTWKKLRDLARGDFRHDFNEGDPGRDQFVQKDEARFFEIAKNVSSKGRVKLTTDFKDNYVGKNIFKLLRDGFDTIVPPATGSLSSPPSDTFFEEPALLDAVGIPFDKIKKDISAREEGDPILQSFEVLPGLVREYTIRSSMYRMGKRGETGYAQNRNISKMFETVTGGKRKFALIIDASGGLPLSEILNATLGPEAVVDTEFYILENIENMSDSATKLTNIKASDGTIPTLRFLKDDTNTVAYPLWNNPEDQKSNIYSRLKIVLNRISDDEVEANILLLDEDGNTDQAFNIGDVANSSNVKNASLYALAVLMEKGVVPEAYVYTLIKRMGDWCQALSLLDRERRYIVLDKDRKPTGETKTLQELSVDTEIGIVTNDRILLAYSILLGLNVFYTTAMDVARLVYFKNNNDLPAGPALTSRAQEIFDSSQLDEGALSAHRTAIETMIAQQTQAIQGQAGVPEYIRLLKNFLSNTGRLRYEFEGLINQHAEAVAQFETATTPIDKFNAANTCASVVAKLQVDIQTNNKTIHDINQGIYPGSQADVIRLGALQIKLKSGGRISKSVEVTEAKNILLGVRDDIRQVLKKGLISGDQIRGLIRPAPEEVADEPRNQSNIREILSVTPAIRLVIESPISGGGQRGGAPTQQQINDVYNAIRTRSIRLLGEGDTEKTSSVNIYKRGHTYIDDKLNAYTVTDEYIVTAEDLTALVKLFQKPATEKHLYIVLKCIILLADIETQKFELLVQQGITEEDVNLPSDIRQPEFSIKGTIQYQQAADGWDKITRLESAAAVLGNLWTPLESRDPLERLNNIRARVMEHPLLRAAPSDLAETQTIQQSFVKAGPYREEISQRVGRQFGLSPDQLQVLGNAIESVVIDVMVKGIPAELVRSIQMTVVNSLVLFNKTPTQDYIGFVGTVATRIQRDQPEMVDAELGGYRLKTYRANKPKRARNSTFRNPV